jgi:hypothetical protein
MQVHWHSFQFFDIPDVEARDPRTAGKALNGCYAGGTVVFLPKSRDRTNRMTKAKKSTLAIHTDVPAMAVKPKMPAIIAIARKTIAQ